MESLETSFLYYSADSGAAMFNYLFIYNNLNPSSIILGTG
jgi:hypothetical protein